jgi:outer membrane protein
MVLIRKCLLTFIILGLIAKGFSQDNKGPIKLSISEAQTYALQNNRTVQSAKLDIEIANKRVWETTAIGLPQFNFATNYQHQFVVPKVSFGSYLDPNALPAGVPITQQNIIDAYKQSPPVELGVKNNTTFDFTVSQLIFSGEYLVGLQAFKVLKQVSEKALVKTEAQTKESVATSYHLVLVFGENIKVLNASLKSIDQTYNDLLKMNQQGFNEETDVDQMKIIKSNMQTLITSLETQKEISIQLLKYQLGMDFEQPLVLTDSISTLINQGNIQYLTAPQFDVNSSIDYQIMSNLEKVSALSLKRQKSTYLPTISGFYRHQEQAKKASFNFAVKDVMGVSLSLPIFTSGQRSAKLSQAKFDLEKSRLDKDNAEQGLIMEFESAKSSYQTAFSNYNINKESMELSKKVYDKTVVKYREGVASSFELAQNQNQFLTSESNYYNSVLSLLNAKAKLDRILTINK